jgi:uncharacterized protein (TIGR00730 family)
MATNSKLPSMKRLPALGESSKTADETIFLATKRSRTAEFRTLLRIVFEYIRGFRALHFVGPAVTVFGSARFGEATPHYKQAVKIGQILAEEGYVTMTGGGPGVMEAANRGAKLTGGYSVGCTIMLPFEYQPNRYLDRQVNFFYFFVRKVMLVKYSYAFVILPGGVGTLDEMMEAITLIQTGKVYDFPVILVGTEYWKGLLHWCKDTLLKEGAIDAADLDRLILTDDPEVVRTTVRNVASRLRLKLRVPAQPSAMATTPSTAQSR